MDKAELLALAERLDGLEIADSYLDREIWIARYGEGLASCRKPFTFSIDAAMALRPRGWTIANLGEGDDGSWWCEMRQGYRTSYGKVAMSAIKCASAAIALTAAALRAHASAMEGEG